MKNLSSTILVITMVAIGLLHTAVAQTIYVSTTGNDMTGNGTASNPYASLAKAQSVIETSTCGSRTQAATVLIGPGIYYLLYSQTSPGTLVFTCKDSGTSSFGVAWEHSSVALGSIVVSGAIQVGGTAGKTGLGLTWTKTSGYSNLYQVTLPATFANTNISPSITFNLQPFEYLYYLPEGANTPTRRLRARVEQSDGVGYYMSGSSCVTTQSPVGTVPVSYCNLGTYLRVASVVNYNGTNCPNVTGQPPNNDGTKCLDRFGYTTSGPDQIENWANLNGTYTGTPNGTGFSGPCEATSGSTYPEGDVGLTLIDAWTVDAMRIACIDTTDQIIYLTGPTKGNSGVENFFGPVLGHRYYIENARDAFFVAQSAGQSGLWYWDRSTSVLYYIANSGENPTSDTVLIPQLPYSSGVGSSQQLTNQFPQTSGGKESGDFVGGSLIWAKAPSSGQSGLSYVTFNGITFEMDDFVPLFTGFNNDVNGEMPVPQTIDCESCQNVTFNGVTVAYTSGSGLLIASPPGNKTATAAATEDTIENSSFLDIGDSGIRIGRSVASTDQSSYVVNDLTVNNNLVDGYSRVFADGEGVAEGNGQTITISHNDITDGYHAGISICQLGCGPFNSSGQGVNGSNVTSTYNRLWNLMQGVTSDGGSLYYNIGDVGGSGENDLISNNLVHDTTDSVIIDGGFGYKGTGYGGEGIYLDILSAGVLVENNVVYHMSAHTAWMTEAPTTSFSSNPNTFQNNIFSLAIQGMFEEQTPWPNGCTSGTFTTAKLLWNIWNFDLNETPSSANSFMVVGGCSNSCGQKYYQFQDFEANAYYRANTANTGYPLFCSDSYAYHVLASPGSGGSCPSNYSQSQYDFLTFDSPAGGSLTWQHGAPPSTPVVIDEDDGQDTTTVLGTCSWNPNFGTTGNPSDYTLSSGPNSDFNVTYTNNTISTAGRSSQPTPPSIPETLPTYSYGNTSF
jgi:hypothetical protein